MLNKEELIITFPNEEEKEIFMKWFETTGFDNFINKSKTDISCISSIEYGETTNDLEYLEIPNGFIELQ